MSLIDQDPSEDSGSGGVLNSLWHLARKGQGIVPDRHKGSGALARIDQAMVVAGLAATAMPLATALWNLAFRKKSEPSRVLFFPEGSTSCEALLAWAARNGQDGEDAAAARSVLMSVNRNRGDDGTLDTDVVWETRSESKHTMEFMGYPVSIEKTWNFNPTGEEIPKPGHGYDHNSYRPGYVVTLRSGRKDLADRFVTELASVMLDLRRERKRKKFVYIHNWGWNKATRVQESAAVCLPDGVMEDLEEDLQRFLSSQEDYDLLGIPHRRGYLLHGIPRSGKTATIRHLAGKLDKDLYVLSLSNKDNDKISEALSGVPGTAILVLEDIDSVSLDIRGNSDGDTSKKVSLDVLLNILDGLSTQQGQLVFLTANSLLGISEKLLMRGRVDVRVQFTYATIPQIRKYGEKLGIPDSHIEQAVLDFGDGEHVMAEVQERYRDIYFQMKEERFLLEKQKHTKNDNNNERQVGDGDTGGRIRCGFIGDHCNTIRCSAPDFDSEDY